MNVYIPTENITDMRGPCPEGFHIPTIDEWNNFRSIYNNIVDSGDRDTATHLYVNMGYCGVFTDNGGSIHFEISKSNANYYRLCENYDTYRAYDTIIMSKSIGQGGPYHLGKSNLYLIRPFSDSVIEPSVGRTTIYQGEGTNGIYHNSTLGIITLIYDTNKITIADRDAGASSAGGQGLQYQRGNNYGFNYSAGNYYSFINSTINASSYGPGNYYNSGTTPRASRMDSTTYFWDSSNNKNLRGGVTGPLKMNELKNAYIGEVWTPNASRTLLYLPLESDTNDYSGNNRTCTPTSVSFTTVGGVKSAHVGTSGGIAVGPNDFITKSIPVATMSALVYVTNQTTSARRYIFEFCRASNAHFFGLINNNVSYYTVGGANSGSGQLSSSSGSVIANKWNHILYTADSSSIELYINGTKVATGSGVTYPRGNGQSSIDYPGQNILCSRNGSVNRQSLNGNAREVIFENIKWSAAQVSNYYNQIKQQLGF